MLLLLLLPSPCVAQQALYFATFELRGKLCDEACKKGKEK